MPVSILVVMEVVPRAAKSGNLIHHEVLVSILVVMEVVPRGRELAAS